MWVGVRGAKHGDQKGIMLPEVGRGLNYVVLCMGTIYWDICPIIPQDAIRRKLFSHLFDKKYLPEGVAIAIFIIYTVCILLPNERIVLSYGRDKSCSTTSQLEPNCCSIKLTICVSARLSSLPLFDIVCPLADVIRIVF